MTDSQFNELLEFLCSCDTMLFKESGSYDRFLVRYKAAGEIELPGCGLTKLWWTGIDDPFLWAGCWHDLYYPDREGYIHHNWPRKDVDDLFYYLCLATARYRESLYLKFKAWLYYQIVKMFKVEKWQRRESNLT